MMLRRSYRLSLKTEPGDTQNRPIKTEPLDTLPCPIVKTEPAEDDLRRDAIQLRSRTVQIPPPASIGYSLRSRIVLKTEKECDTYSTKRIKTETLPVSRRSNPYANAEEVLRRKTPRSVDAEDDSAVATGESLPVLESPKNFDKEPTAADDRMVVTEDEVAFVEEVAKRKVLGLFLVDSQGSSQDNDPEVVSNEENIPTVIPESTDFVKVVKSENEVIEKDSLLQMSVSGTTNQILPSSVDVIQIDSQASSEIDFLYAIELEYKDRITRAEVTFLEDVLNNKLKDERLSSQEHNSENVADFQRVSPLSDVTNLYDCDENVSCSEVAFIGEIFCKNLGSSEEPIIEEEILQMVPVSHGTSDGALEDNDYTDLDAVRENSCRPEDAYGDEVPHSFLKDTKLNTTELSNPKLDDTRLVPVDEEQLSIFCNETLDFDRLDKDNPISHASNEDDNKNKHIPGLQRNNSFNLSEENLDQLDDISQEEEFYEGDFEAKTEVPVKEIKDWNNCEPTEKVDVVDFGVNCLGIESCSSLVPLHDSEFEVLTQLVTNNSNAAVTIQNHSINNAEIIGIQADSSAVPIVNSYAEFSAEDMVQAVVSKAVSNVSACPNSKFHDDDAWLDEFSPIDSAHVPNSALDAEIDKILKAVESTCEYTDNIFTATCEVPEVRLAQNNIAASQRGFAADKNKKDEVIADAEDKEFYTDFVFKTPAPIFSRNSASEPLPSLQTEVPMASPCFPPMGANDEQGIWKIAPSPGTLMTPSHYPTKPEATFCRMVPLISSSKNVPVDQYSEENVADFALTEYFLAKEPQVFYDYNSTKSVLPSFRSTFQNAFNSLLSIENEDMAEEYFQASQYVSSGSSQSKSQTDSEKEPVLLNIGGPCVSPIPEDIENSFYWSPTVRYMSLSPFEKFFDMDKVNQSKDPELEYLRQISRCSEIDKVISAEYRERQRLGQIPPDPEWLVKILERNRILASGRKAPRSQRTPAKRKLSFDEAAKSPKRKSSSKKTKSSTESTRRTNKKVSSANVTKGRKRKVPSAAMASWSSSQISDNTSTANSAAYNQGKELANIVSGSKLKFAVENSASAVSAIKNGLPKLPVTAKIGSVEDLYQEMKDLVFEWFDKSANNCASVNTSSHIGAEDIHQEMKDLVFEWLFKRSNDSVPVSKVAVISANTKESSKPSSAKFSFDVDIPEELKIALANSLTQENIKYWVILLEFLCEVFADLIAMRYHPESIASFLMVIKSVFKVCNSNLLFRKLCNLIRLWNSYFNLSLCLDVPPSFFKTVVFMKALLKKTNPWDPDAFMEYLRENSENILRELVEGEADGNSLEMLLEAFKNETSRVLQLESTAKCNVPGQGEGCSAEVTEMLCSLLTIRDVLHSRTDLMWEDMAMEVEEGDGAINDKSIIQPEGVAPERPEASADNDALPDYVNNTAGSNSPPESPPFELAGPNSKDGIRKCGENGGKEPEEISLETRTVEDAQPPEDEWRLIKLRQDSLWLDLHTLLRHFFDENDMNLPAGSLVLQSMNNLPIDEDIVMRYPTVAATIISISEGDEEKSRSIALQLLTKICSVIGVKQQTGMHLMRHLVLKTVLDELDRLKNTGK